MRQRELVPSDLQRTAARDVRLGDIGYLAQVDADLASLEERWGVPEIVSDDLADWVCFAFSSGDGEVFLLQREVDHAPAGGFVLSVTRGLFSRYMAGQIVGALGIGGVRITQINAAAP